MFEDNDFEDFMNDDQDDFQFDLKNHLEAHRERMIADAIEDNYAAIEDKGISEWHLRHMEAKELQALKTTLDTMIEYFIKYEEYEKCALLQKHLSNVNFALQKTRTASQDI